MEGILIIVNLLLRDIKGMFKGMIMRNNCIRSRRRKVVGICSRMIKGILKKFRRGQKALELCSSSNKAHLYRYYLVVFNLFLVILLKCFK